MNLERWAINGKLCRKLSMAEKCRTLILEPGNKNRNFRGKNIKFYHSYSEGKKYEINKESLFEKNTRRGSFRFEDFHWYFEDFYPLHLLADDVIETLQTTYFFYRNTFCNLLNAVNLNLLKLK